MFNDNLWRGKFYWGPGLRYERTVLYHSVGKLRLCYQGRVNSLDASRGKRLREYSGTGLRYTIRLGSCADVPTDRPVSRTAAKPTRGARSRVLVVGTRGISSATPTGDDALAGSQPAQCPELNTDGGLPPLRWEQVAKAQGHYFVRRVDGRGAAAAATGRQGARLRRWGKNDFL